VLWFWLLVAPALLLALRSRRAEQRRASYIAQSLSGTPAGLPPASVIVPVKGLDEDLDENLAALASLDYPDYELIVVACAAADIPPGVLPSGVRVVLAGGGDSRTGEKVQNLIAGVRATRKTSQIFAFADSDGRVETGWLRALAVPLMDEQVGASTGYRWYTPRRITFWTLIRSVWNAAIAGQLGPGPNRFAWGGAMAIRKETFFELRVLEYWKGVVSDDYALSAAVRRAGLRIAFASGAMVFSVDDISPGDLLSWLRRQLLITRVYDPGMWFPALAAHILYCAAMAASLAALERGYPWAALALAAQLLPAMYHARQRARAAEAALPSQNAWFRRYGWVYSALNPIATWIWLAALLSSALGNTIEWRGRVYRLHRPVWPE